MKLVADTNVLVSALLTPAGPCGQILDLLTDGAIQGCFDARILSEYEEVLLDPRFPFTAKQVSTTLDVFRVGGTPVAALPLDVSLPHEDDRPFLEAAAAAHVPLVTGNTKHYPARARAGVTVLTPSQFLELLRRQS